MNTINTLLNKCMYAVIIYFFTFPISKELYIFSKKDAVTAYFFLLFQYLKNFTLFSKKDEHGFLSHPKHCLSAKNQQQTMMMPTWVGASQKFGFFVQKSWFSVIVTTSIKILWRHAIHTIFAFSSFPFFPNHDGSALSCSTRSVFYNV